MAKFERPWMLDALKIDLVVVTAERVVARMPITEATRQPFGLLHGGASVALAETAASLGTLEAIDPEKEIAVGSEINANHVRGKAEGVVTATAVPVHRGRTTMVWDIRICDEDGRLISISRCTMAIRPKRAE